MGAAGLRLEGDKEESFAVVFANGATHNLTIPKGMISKLNQPIPCTSLRPLNSAFSQLFSFFFTHGERVSVMDKDDFKMIAAPFEH